MSLSKNSMTDGSAEIDTSHTPTHISSSRGHLSHTQQTAGGGSCSSGSGGEQGHLFAWVSNDRVMSLLRHATKALKAGRLTEEQLEAVLLQEVQVGLNVFIPIHDMP